MKLLVARHAPPAEKGVCYGRLDVSVQGSPVDASARLQATLPHRPSVIWSSPSARCSAVGRVLASSLELGWVTDARLQELDFGAWEGLRWDDIEARGREFTAWARDWKKAAPPGGESLPELEARLEAWLRELSGEPAVITHAGIIRALLVRFRGLTWDEAMSTPVPHLEWVSLDLDPRD